MRWFGKKKEEADGEVQKDTTRCSTCGSQRIPMNHNGFSLLICARCRMLDAVPPITKTYQIYIGKTLTGIGNDGFLRMHVDYPSEKRGIQIIRMAYIAEKIRLSSYIPSIIFRSLDFEKLKSIMKKGDTLAFACDGCDPNGIPPRCLLSQFNNGKCQRSVSQRCHLS